VDLVIKQFQSAPPRGRRRGKRRGNPPRPCFNPRLRVGGDPHAPSGRPPASVSIRASAWEATTPRRGSVTREEGFQSAPPRGRRPAGSVPNVVSVTFQSAPPRGRRLLPASRSARWSAFQSAPPRGRRRALLGVQAVPFAVSIRASAWEATSPSKLISRATTSFNPRLRVGGDLRRPMRRRTGTGFNPRLRVGGDLLAGARARAFPSFNPRLRVGGDVACAASAPISCSFNPRLRVGGD